MSILKLKPACKDYLWGGHRLVDEYNVEYDGDILAEAWELSCHPDGPSMIVNGPYAGKSLQEYLDTVGMEALGTHCRRFREFPILTKFIDAKDNLSIQVHPCITDSKKRSPGKNLPAGSSRIRFLTCSTRYLSRREMSSSSSPEHSTQSVRVSLSPRSSRTPM